MDIDQFYEQDPRRQTSDEVEFGREWSEHGLQFEVAWVADTGEVYGPRRCRLPTRPRIGGRARTIHGRTRPRRRSAGAGPARRTGQCPCARPSRAVWARHAATDKRQLGTKAAGLDSNDLAVYGRGMTTLGPDLDAARARVVAHGLAAKAFAQLTPVVTELNLSLEALGSVKQLQKRFFSDAAWIADDDEALADAFGPGVDGMSSFELEPGLTLLWGWEDGRFRLRVASDEPASGDDPPTAADPPTAELDELFDGVVVPEATPSPRTISFATPPLHAGPSRAYASAVAATDPRVARLFTDFDVVTDVLVGPDFVAVTISRPDRWERVLGPMLHLVNEAFVGGDEESPAPARTPTTSLTVASDPERAGAGRAR